MKNVILTHNELQLNLFYAVSYGLQCQQPGKDLWIIAEVTEREFQWKVVQHPTFESCAVAGKSIFYFQINKGDYQMNDLRLGVTTSYMREQAEKFLAEFKAFYESEVPPQKESPLQRPSNYHLGVLLKELKFGRPAASQKFLDDCIERLNKKK